MGTVFPSDDGLLKMPYLATMDITKNEPDISRTEEHIHSQPKIYFEERLAVRNL